MRLRRPLIALCISYALGLLLGCAVPYISAELVWAVAVAVLAAVAALFIKRKDVVASLICILFILMGFMRFQYRFYIAGDGLDALADEEVVLTGTVVKPLSAEEGKDSYIVAVDKTKARIRLTIYSDGEEDVYRYGDRIAVSGMLQVPSQRRNPGGFDYRAYLKSQGIYHIMSVNAEQVRYLGRGRMRQLSSALMAFRQRLIDGIDSFMPYPENTLLKGILFGYTADMPDAISQAYSMTGMAHILAVSGMNVMFVPLVLAAALKRFKIWPWFKEIISIGAVWAYAVIADLSPSVLRAAIMLSVVLGGRAAHKKPDAANSLFAAGLIILLINPLDIYDVGFMLSFAATAALLLLYQPCVRLLAGFMPAAMAELCAATIAPQIGVLPIIAYYFNQLPLLSLLANITIIPFNGLMFIAGLILSLLAALWPGLAAVIGYPLYVMMRSVDIFTLEMARIPIVSLPVPSPSIISILIYYVAIAVVAFRQRIGKRYLSAIGAALTIIMIIMAFNVLKPSDQLQVVFLDVGQGDSIFIRTPSHKAVLIDGGNRVDYMENGFDAGRSIVLPYLRHNGVSHLDLMIYSHTDSDHLGGLRSVLDGLKVDTLLYSQKSEDFVRAALDKGVEVVRLSEDDAIDLGDGVILHVLYPADSGSVGGDNDSSLVLKLQYKDFSLLLPGDIEAGTEEQLAERADLKSTAIKVPHHGSDTSSTMEFVSAVKPQIAVISVGKNDFGQPSADVIRRYDAIGAKVYRTDQYGAISIYTDGRNLRIKTVIEG